MSEEPRAITEDELCDMLIEKLKSSARYWAAIPDVDKFTGKTLTVLDRCEGVLFSVLTCLDGATMGLPGFDLVATPHEDDKEYHKSNGENWIEPGTKISTSLHEQLYKKRRSGDE